MSRIKTLVFLLALTAQLPLASAKTITYAVGTCEPKLVSFTTISSALAATPPPNVVEVCPGTYKEQILITFPVTLEGVSVGNSDQAIIAPPPGGLVINAYDDRGDDLAAQVVVQNAGGEVDLTNLTVDATGNDIIGRSIAIVGVFYQNTPGTVNRLTIQNQNGNLEGVGIWLEGGSANPSITMENSNLQNFDFAGIEGETETLSGTSELTATIKGNDLASSFDGSNGFLFLFGLTASVTDNLINGGTGGMLIYGGNISVSKNTIVSADIGIDVENDSISVTSNTIYNTATGTGTGIVANSAVAPVTGNTIVRFPTGIDFKCTAGNNVHSNTILVAGNGLLNVPTGTVSANTYYNLGTMSSGGC